LKKYDPSGISGKETPVAKKVAKKVTKKVVKKPAKKIAKKASKKLTPPKLPEIGKLAPAFSLKDQNGKLVSLESLRGSNVVVYFYPRAMTPGCTVQACGFRDSIKELKQKNIVVLGISGDPHKSLKKFEERDRLNFPLLSDEDHEVAKAYGSWGMKKFMGREFMGILRQSFFINPEGKLVHIISKVETKTHHDTVLAFFKNQK
jgi:peroxiredoxin Q/BCP